ncbi:MAG TPA: hypothetical protein VE152_08840 [Acidimicrobiales bacterium]|nr:hypothetical protein [Acidimicrobiales bacterium]
MATPSQAAPALLRRAGTPAPTPGDPSGSTWRAYHLPAPPTMITGRAGHTVVRHLGVRTADTVGGDDPNLTGHAAPGHQPGEGS